MVDHLLSSSMIEAILASPPSADEIALAIDRRQEETLDPTHPTTFPEQDGNEGKGDYRLDTLHRDGPRGAQHGDGGYEKEPGHGVTHDAQDHDPSHGGWREGFDVVQIQNQAQADYQDHAAEHGQQRSRRRGHMLGAHSNQDIAAGESAGRQEREGDC